MKLNQKNLQNFVSNLWMKFLKDFKWNFWFEFQKTPLIYAINEGKIDIITLLMIHPNIDINLKMVSILDF